MTVANGDSPPAKLPVNSELLWPSLQVGALSGIAGGVIGGSAGIIRSTTPVLFAAASGLQCFTLGTAFWGARGMVLSTRIPGTITGKEKIYASTVGGGAAGGLVAAIFRGRANIAPGIITLAMIGGLGQVAYNTINPGDLSSDTDATSKPRKPMLERLANSRWSPVKILSDEEYENMLQEKLLRVEAEIAVLDEHIENLRRETREKLQEPSQKHP